MRRFLAVPIVVGAICLSPTCVWPAIIDIDLQFGVGYHDPSKAQYTWSFDHELQHLTIIEEFFDPYLVGKAWLDVEGLTDSETLTFSVTKTVTNSTGLPWSDYWFRYGLHPRVWRSDDWAEMTEFTQWQTMVQTGEFDFHFSDPGGLLDGETFTLQFDVHVNPLPAHGGLFCDASWHSYAAVPEPASAVLLSVGGLAFVRRRGSGRDKGRDAVQGR